MAYVYVSSNWAHPDKNVVRELKQKGVEVYDWSIYKNISLQQNAELSMEAIKDTKAYVVIFSDPNHQYQGTYELMALALAFKKPVIVYVDCPENPGDINGRYHRWRTKFDRFLLYHPKVSVFTQEQILKIEHF